MSSHCNVCRWPNAMIAGKDILKRAHGALVFGRRVRILAANLAKEIPIRAEVLDVGTGDGSIAKAIALHRPDIKIEGIDVLIRPYRVSRRYIVIKDHLREGPFAKATLQAAVSTRPNRQNRSTCSPMSVPIALMPPRRVKFLRYAL